MKNPLLKLAAALLVGTCAGGGVKSNTTFDIHLSYTLSEGDWLGRYLPGTQFFVDVQNMFDRAPVFYNGNTGYDGYAGNPIGRLTTFGLRTKF